MTTQTLNMLGIVQNCEARPIGIHGSQVSISGKNKSSSVWRPRWSTVSASVIGNVDWVYTVWLIGVGGDKNLVIPGGFHGRATE